MIDVNIEDFKNLLSMAGAFASEATFIVRDNRLEVMVIDTAHVAMARGSIPLASKPDVDRFTIDIEKAIKAIGTTGSNISIQVGEGVMVLKGEKSKASISLFASSNNDIRKVPNYEVTAYAEIVPSRLKTTLAFGQYAKADYVRIQIEEGVLHISTGVYPNIAEIEGDEVGAGTAMAGFMMDYVHTVADLASKAKCNLKVNLGGDDYPVLFEWGNENAKYSVLVAPRIES